VIDADAVGHDVLTQPAVIDRIGRRFGLEVISHGDGGAARVDRRALGAIVFGDASARHDLESIVHPLMKERFQAEIRGAEAGGAVSMVVLDAAILLEAGWNDLCDKIVFVNASVFERLRRVGLTRGWTREAFESRQRAQWSCEQKRARADFVIENDADEESLTREVDRFERWVDEGCPPCDRSRLVPTGEPAQIPSPALTHGSC
jgi:dephospho-CoA kinase